SAPCASSSRRAKANSTLQKQNFRGGGSRERLISMDEKFCERVLRAMAAGDENPTAAINGAESTRPRQRLRMLALLPPARSAWARWGERQAGPFRGSSDGRCFRSS